MFEVRPPDDLAMTPEDPFCAQDGYGPAWPYCSISLLDPRIYYVRVFAAQSRDEAEAVSLELGRKIADGGYAGLILDYRGADMPQDAPRYRAIAQAFAANFPRNLLIVLLCDARTDSLGALMCRLLRGHGLRVARMSDFDEAWAAIARRINSPAG